MGLWISSAVLILGWCFLNSPTEPAVVHVSGTIGPEWMRDLRPVIGSDPLGLALGGKHEMHGRARSSLWFLDNNTIIISFVTGDNSENALSTREGSDFNQPLRLQTVFLEVETGRVKLTQAWPTPSRFAGIVAANDRSFLTQRGRLLTLYSSDATEIKRLTLPALPKRSSGWYWGWQAHSSLTGRHVLFALDDLMTTSPGEWIWVDTETLEITHSWNEVQSGGIAISDNAVAMGACAYWQYHCEPKIEFRQLTTTWKTIAEMEKRTHPGGVQFIDEDTLFLSGEPWKLLRTDGKEVMTGAASAEGDTAVVSADSRRFVIPGFTVIGKTPALDIGGHGELRTVSVYDAPFHERSYRLEVKRVRIGEFAKLALSPDGSKLAVLYNETVYVFQLPPHDRNIAASMN